MAHQNDIETRRRMLLFRAQHRGFREMDLIFGAFAERHLALLDESGLDDFDRLLSVPDWQLYGWIIGQETVPSSEDTEVFRLLASYRDNIGGR